MRSERDEGQMMLLAAIVLLIAFVSMAVMISRVTLVASETSRDQHGPFLREAAAVSQALELFANSATPDNTVLGTQISDLQAFEAQRGYLLSWDCAAGNGANPDTFRLTDGRSTFTVANLRGADACN